MNASPAPKPRLRLPEAQPIPAIVYGSREQSDDEGRKWSRALVWFMRLTSILWLGLGLYYWSQILGEGAGGPITSGFMEMSLARQTGVVFFATLDFVAAIGLWLIAPWGGVVWLFTALSEIVAAGVLPQLRLGLGPAASLGLNAALVAVFFLLNIMAAREQDAE
jgi:hypothetical protein